MRRSTSVSPRPEQPVGNLAVLAAGGVHDHHPVAVVDRLGQGAGRGDALVVGMGVEGDQGGHTRGPITGRRGRPTGLAAAARPGRPGSLTAGGRRAASTGANETHTGSVSTLANRHPPSRAPCGEAVDRSERRGRLRSELGSGGLPPGRAGRTRRRGWSGPWRDRRRRRPSTPEMTCWIPSSGTCVAGRPGRSTASTALGDPTGGAGNGGRRRTCCPEVVEATVVEAGAEAVDECGDLVAIARRSDT